MQINMDTTIDVMVGVVTHRAGAYVLDKFLTNQKDIQQNHPSSKLVLATNEPDFVSELEAILAQWDINGEVLLYETVKPSQTRSRIWNIACGREAMRQYILKRTYARYLIMFDSDMTYDFDVIDILLRELQGCDIVYSGYTLRQTTGIALAGTGCCIIKMELLEAIKFRCLEFKNGYVLQEDTLLELDLIRLRKRIKKGFFVHIEHYYNSFQNESIRPQPVGLFRKIMHSKLVRLVLIRASIIFRCDVAGRLATIVYRIAPHLARGEK
jgi:hypothetical protein